MEIRQLTKYKAPNYPTKEAFNLSSNPFTWDSRKRLKKKLAGGALLTFIFAGSSTAADPSICNKPPVETRDKKDKRDIKQMVDIKIAPIFLHGYGQGAIGCIVISPPAFLSEMEAMEIIEKKLQEAGILIDQKNFLIDKIELHDSHPFYFEGYNSHYNLGIKYISKWNYFKTGSPRDLSSVQTYDMVVAAQRVREKLKNYNKINAVVFYDPMVSYYERGLSTIKEQDESRNFLEAQVVEFINWFLMLESKPVKK